MKSLIFSILVGWLGTTIGWAQATLRGNIAPNDSEEFHVVVIGSSTAAGQGPGAPREAWVNRYRTHLLSHCSDCRVTNLAAGGYVSYQLLPNWSITPPGRPRPDRQRNVTMALSLQPDLIILNLPSNDVAAGYQLGEQRLNVRRVVQSARQLGVPVYVCTTQPRVFPPEQVAQQEAMRDWIERTYGAYAIDFWTGLADCAGWPKEEYDSGDGVHLNGAAHSILYQRVAETLSVMRPREEQVPPATLSGLTPPD